MVGIVMAGEHRLFMDLVCSALRRRGLVVLDQAHSPEELEGAVRRHRPEVCLLDGGPDAWPAVLVRDLVLQGGATVVRLIADDDERTAREAVAAGARKCLYRSQSVDELVRALHGIANGIEDDLTLPRRAVGRAGRGTSGGDVRRLADALTARERECLALAVAGVPTVGMVAELGISVTTVRSHIQSMLHKLGVRSRIEAVSLAVRYDLVTDVRPAS